MSRDGRSASKAVRLGLIGVAGVLLVGAFAWPSGSRGDGPLARPAVNSMEQTTSVAASAERGAPSTTADPAVSPSLSIGGSTLTTAAVAPTPTSTLTGVTTPSTGVTAGATAAATGSVVSTDASTGAALATARAPLDPSWPKTITILTDSVVLGAKDTLIKDLSADGWTVDVQGRPALMANLADKELKAAGKPVGSVVVVALGYNSLWEKDRANFAKWSDRFDGHAESLLATLGSLGAKRVVWVTLREPSVEIVPPKALKQYRSYAWYFPYVNERLRAFHERHPEVALADWAAVSNVAGLTYDAIHLNPKGARLMVATIREAAGV